MERVLSVLKKWTGKSEEEIRGEMRLELEELELEVSALKKLLKEGMECGKGAGEVVAATEVKEEEKPKAKGKAGGSKKKTTTTMAMETTEGGGEVKEEEKVKRKEKN